MGNNALRRKTYTFNLDDNPLFCIIIHIISLAFDDDAFGVPDLVSPDQVFRLRVRRHQGFQPIPWKKEMLDKPIFRRTIATKHGVQMSSDKPLTCNVSFLGQAAGRIAWLSLDPDNVLFATSVGQRDQRYDFPFLPARPNAMGRSEYSMLISPASASSDGPNSNPAVRNLALDHTGSIMFERNYLSRILRCSTQNAYWGRTPDNDAAKAASRIGRLRDPRRPRKRTEHQSQQVRWEPRIIDLCDVRDRVRAEIVSKYGVVKMAEGERIYEDHQKLR